MKAFSSLKNLILNRTNRCAASIVLLMISLVTIGAVNDAAVKEVSINEVNVFAETEEKTILTTRKKTVGELLDDYGIVVNEYDNLNCLKTDSLDDINSITLRRGIMFHINTANGIIDVSTTKKTVGEALIEAGIYTDDMDEIIPPRDTSVEYDMTVNIAKIEIREETVSEVISYDTLKRETDEMYVGTKKVKQEGSNGSKDVTYRITVKDGSEVAREAVSENITKEAVDEIILVGTKNNIVNVKAASNGALSSRGEMRYKKKINVVATAYDTSPEQNGGSTRSASGTPLKYGVIAVDPSVIPLGSRVYVESSDGGKSWVYGYAVASDKGGAIKGNKIDLCFESSSAASNFGKRNATIYILD